ncbi:hypothetical protein, variant [Puccinia triticina 1-1 BBBD Race 1]|uniref:CxC1 domain-containing protein n=1 Tax=Puccinia triticina (isolate 1-1 / race 1 (BBBD)) TaxID=630390 RepID=A0A180H2F8_PUCT1|nr:hypothetical protein, variant [Puccinia triticina 1-1 BBBD Race 1]
MPPRKTRTDFYKFHYRSQLSVTETRTQRKARLDCLKRVKAEVSNRPSRNINGATNQDQNVEESASRPEVEQETDDQNPLGFSKNSPWEDNDVIMNEEEAASLARIRSLHQQLIQQQKNRNWIDLMGALFPVYLYLKKQTLNWTLPCAFDDFSSLVCNCTPDQYKPRDVDLIDLMGQKRAKFVFCSCTPDPVRLLANGYLSSTPIFPQTAFSVRLLNFYDLLWNFCNVHTTSFCKALQRWNESISMRLSVKTSSKPRELRRNLAASIDVYRNLKSMQRNLVHTVTSTNKQDILAQRSCPACFGVTLPVNDAVTSEDDSARPNNNNNVSTQSSDTNKVFICLDGNFQHRHHERASKNYVEIKNQTFFIPPEDIETSNVEIREAEIAKRVSQKAKDNCTQQHKAADDRRNASSWKGCDDTGLFGCCCRHDSVILFCNIHKTGEGRGLPMSILKQLFDDINPNVQLGVLYDIGCTLEKFFKARGLLSNQLPRMSFATAVFHSYVHDWPCQLEFNPRYNEGWGLTDGEGLERLWSDYSPLVGPLRHVTRNRRFGSLSHRTFFRNMRGIENLLLVLKRKFTHAIATKMESEGVIQKLLCEKNPHDSVEYFTVDFFRAQWQNQRLFELNRSQNERAQLEEQAQFVERGEALKSLAESLVAHLENPPPNAEAEHALKTLEQIRELRKQQDKESENLGSFFSAEPGIDRNPEKERRLALLWSAKTALYKCAVQIQGETQPLRDSKSRGQRLGTVLKEKIFDALARRKKTATRFLKIFCDRRIDYLKNHAPDELSRPENKAIGYDDFIKLPLDDPFWNDGSMCMCKEPWAVNPTVRSGIHAVLRLDRAKEELVQLTNELRRCLSWGIHHRNQLKLCIDQCVFNTVNEKLKSNLENLFGEVTYQSRKIVGDELESVQKEHENLLLSWHQSVNEILLLGFVNRSILPDEWFALVQFLQQSTVKDFIEDSVDLLLEETVLNDQDSDGESLDEEANNTANPSEHRLPDEDNGQPGEI